MTTKKPYTFRLNKALIEKLRVLANKDNRKLTNFIETILSSFVKNKKE